MSSGDILLSIKSGLLEELHRLKWNFWYLSDRVYMVCHSSKIEQSRFAGSAISRTVIRLLVPFHSRAQNRYCDMAVGTNFGTFLTQEEWLWPRNLH
jgi:hypothetical protein